MSDKRKDLVRNKLDSLGFSMELIYILVSSGIVSRLVMKEYIGEATVVFYVPKKSVKEMAGICNAKAPAGMDFAVLPLNRPMKKHLIERVVFERGEARKVNLDVRYW